MKYRETQRQRAVAYRDILFRDPGAGLFFGKQREFVLHTPSLNLWAGIRDDARQYFSTHRIPWWKGTKTNPSGHLLSSQIACVNHLYAIRQRKDVAVHVLRQLVPSIYEALPVDDGYVAFEFIGTRRYLKEKSFTRGANCTSVDAAMLGRFRNGRRMLFLIEWKYTESYGPDDLYIPRRAKVYDSMIRSRKGPMVAGLSPRVLYVEPFYQMMRQTLLAWQFEKHRELGCSRCVNIHVIPRDNQELKKTITSPGLEGRDIHEAWRNVLRKPDNYIPVDPRDLLAGAQDLPDTASWLNYLKSRYW